MLLVVLLTAVLGTGRSSHLFSTLVRQRQAATSSAAFTFGLIEGSDLLIANAIGRPGANPDSQTGSPRGRRSITVPTG